MPPSLAAVLTAVVLAVLGGAAGAFAGRVVPLFHDYEPGPDDAGPPPPCCPHCGARVAWRRWAPLPGRLVGTGRCAACAVRVRAPIAAVASLAAAALGLLGLLRPEWSPLELLAFAFFGLWGVLLAVIDARTRRLPNPLVLPAYPVALVLVGLASLTARNGYGHLVGALIGMAGLAAFYWLLWFIYPAGMGWGDVKLSGLLGLYLGWTGLGAVVSGTFAAFLLSACFGLVLILLGRATRKTQIPFGPFMLIGAFAVILLGDPLPALLG
ncbi:leader peptidase (prepilin peptidase)/N-methyltransferase [Spinactinospora alkalitolerans]|uniref:Leader peptidase (Prepilin peptidase)/N-methyltransferase n=1 Tax=Spinactinospora alkalitolerans TaxID=687207 RepID=A0A852TXZ0_9ACTN|nr:A24 family peptidase [Spinactinospora alkalitolerans]NYE48641.1 leader peptidase (prepilin peptidase)/N-methyltransferase [Spinactinospora alkalitolerans]